MNPGTGTHPEQGLPTPPASRHVRAVVFILAAALCASPLASGPVALAAGIALALAGMTAFEARSKKLSRILVQTCVVLLGFRLGVGQLFGAAAEGLVFAIASIGGTLALGWLLGRVFKTGGELGTLVNSGTAICGASAITAVGSAMGAATSSMAVATGAIFVLNAIGLWTLPAIGHAMQLSEVQFGTWAGVALHDVASVAAAAGGYHRGIAEGSVALDTANVVKMTRVLWIIPLAFAAAWTARRGSQHGPARGAIAVPWFIGLFVLASVLRSLVPAIAEAEHAIRVVAAAGFQLALFLIGAGLSRKALKTVGWRVLAHATVLWIAVATTTLFAVRALLD